MAMLFGVIIVRFPTTKALAVSHKVPDLQNSPSSQAAKQRVPLMIASGESQSHCKILRKGQCVMNKTVVEGWPEINMDKY